MNMDRRKQKKKTWPRLALTDGADNIVPVSGGVLPSLPDHAFEIAFGCIESGGLIF